MRSKTPQFYSTVQMDVPVIDTNGAGAGLAAGLLSSYYLEEIDLKSAVLRGQIAARYTCTKRASTSHLISMEELNQYHKILNYN